MVMVACIIADIVYNSKHGLVVDIMWNCVTNNEDKRMTEEQYEASQELHQYSESQDEILRLRDKIAQKESQVMNVCKRLKEQESKLSHHDNAFELQLHEFIDLKSASEEKIKTEEEFCNKIKLKLEKIDNPYYLNLLWSHFIHYKTLQWVADACGALYDEIYWEYQCALKEYIEVNK